MALTGKLNVEFGVQAPAAKFFNILATQLHHVQNLTDRVHQTKLHEGDWHSIGSVKHWTYVIDGKVKTCKEKIEAIDEQNKTIKFNLFDGDIGQHYKIFKLIFQVTDRNEGGAVVKWTIEYENINEDIEPPYGYMEFYVKGTKDLDRYLLKE